jgi:hypothetical protein
VLDEVFQPLGVVVELLVAVPLDLGALVVGNTLAPEAGLIGRRVVVFDDRIVTILTGEASLPTGRPTASRTGSGNLLAFFSSRAIRRVSTNLSRYAACSGLSGLSIVKLP